MEPLARGSHGCRFSPRLLCICRQLLPALSGVTAHSNHCHWDASSVLAPAWSWCPQSWWAGGIIDGGQAVALLSGGPCSICVPCDACGSPCSSWADPGQCQWHSWSRSPLCHQHPWGGHGWDGGSYRTGLPKRPCPVAAVGWGCRWPGGLPGSRVSSPPHQDCSSRPRCRWRGKGNICSVRSWFAEREPATLGSVWGGDTSWGHCGEAAGGMVVPIPPPCAPNLCSQQEAVGDPAVGLGTGFCPHGCCVGHVLGCWVRSWVPPLLPLLHPFRTPHCPQGATPCVSPSQATLSLTPGCAVPLKPCKHRKGCAGLAGLSMSPGAGLSPPPPPVPWGWGLPAWPTLPHPLPTGGANGGHPSPGCAEVPDTGSASLPWAAQRSPPHPEQGPLSLPGGTRRSGFHVLALWVSCSGRSRHCGLRAVPPPVHVLVSVTARSLCACSPWERCVPCCSGSCLGMSPLLGLCPCR